MSGAIKDVTLGHWLPAEYRRAAAKKPVNPKKVLFMDTEERNFPDNFRLVWDRLQAHGGFETQFISLEQNHVSMIKYFQNCIDFVRQAADAAYVFLVDGSYVTSCLPLRPETQVIQLWHACGAFKKWGMSTADLIFGCDAQTLRKHPFYRNLSLVTISSPDVAWAYIEAMMLEDTPEIVQPLGVSRTDVFFDEGFLAEARARVTKVVPALSGKKAILYAPTFRGFVSSAKGPDALDVSAMKEALGEEYVLLVKHHPFVKVPPTIPESCASFAFDVSGKLPIEELLCVADVCVSDYSSVVFEYSLFGRPMAFYAYDLDDYQDWRGFYYNYDELTPGPVFQTSEDLIDYLTHIEERFDPETVASFRRKFMSACDGHATDRICKAVFGQELRQSKTVCPK
nr:CDP-glycerol glycerophosphotransferase family protein [Xiamenia xianingshaonis]